MCARMCVCGLEDNASSHYYLVIYLLFETGLSDLELKKARLAGQQAPGILLFPSP